MMERNELSTELGKLLGALPACDRELLLLRFARGMSGNDIAARLGLPSTFHAYRRINSVLGRLKSDLMRRGFDGAIA
jgi:DNA-directed RNA polymerase specialized sigma24 family protein